MNIIKLITNEIESVEGVKLLNVDPGKATNRTVVTFVGAPEVVVANRGHEDPRIPQLAGQRAFENSACGRGGARCLRRTGGGQDFVFTLLGHGARPGAGDGGRTARGASGLRAGY